jgi:hypothetical protein
LVQEVGQHRAPGAHRVVRILYYILDALLTIAFDPAGIDLALLEILPRIGLVHDPRKQLVSAINLGRVGRIDSPEHAIVQVDDCLTDPRFVLGDRQHVRLNK